MNFTCKSNKPTSFDFCMLGLRFDKSKKLQPSSIYRPSLTAKFSKIRFYTILTILLAKSSPFVTNFQITGRAAIGEKFKISLKSLSDNTFFFWEISRQADYVSQVWGTEKI
jgi:hypothetical protein